MRKAYDLRWAEFDELQANMRVKTGEAHAVAYETVPWPCAAETDIKDVLVAGVTDDVAARRTRIRNETKRWHPGMQHNGTG